MNALTKTRPLLVAVMAMSLLAGCKTLSVHEGDTPREGVPFYVKKNVYRQTSTYATTVWTVSVTVDTLSGPNATPVTTRPLFSRVLSDSAYQSQEMRNLRELILRANAVTTVKQTNFDAFVASLTTTVAALEKLRTSDDCSDVVNPKFCPMVANRVSRELVVDTSKMYYINGRRPLAGTAKSDFALGADLTLTTIKAEQDDKTLEQILSVLPVKEYLSKVLGLTAKDAKTDSGQASLLGFTGSTPPPAKGSSKTKGDVYVRLSLTATPQLVLYKASKSATSDDIAGVLTLCDARAGTNGVSLEREVVAAAAAKKEKTEEAPAYKISGSITLPKSPADAATPADKAGSGGG